MRWLTVALLLVLAAALAYFLVARLRVADSARTEPAASARPPAHSLAVLPFVNMSADPAQEYFSDGLTEELLNSLSHVNGLQVAARTSSFTFKGRQTDIATVARSLNVAAILEGSVRRAGTTVRISAELVNAASGFQLWSQSYDRDLGDVLKLQTEIANAVAGALEVKLMGDEAVRIELGGTRNAAAFDAYLHAARAFTTSHVADDLRFAVAGFDEALRLDPDYALAYTGRARALIKYATQLAPRAEVADSLRRAEADARHALELAPDLAEAHLALGNLYWNELDFRQAGAELERARTLAPGDARTLGDYGELAALMGRSSDGVAAARRAVVLDPLNTGAYFNLGFALFYTRQYPQAVEAFDELLALDPDSPGAHASKGRVLYMQGNYGQAAASCELRPEHWLSQLCLAISYERLGRHAEARGMRAQVVKSLGDAGKYQVAEIYAQWGEEAQALDALDAALRLRDPGLSHIRTDPLLDPLRETARFAGIEHALNFP
jgi:TolB-like protein/tetratricopeptide (TPR) repeat protein